MYRVAEISALDKFRSRYFMGLDKYLANKKIVGEKFLHRKKNPVISNAVEDTGEAMREPLFEDTTFF